jgi:hypothetical protein
MKFLMILTLTILAIGSSPVFSTVILDENPISVFIAKDKNDKKEGSEEKPKVEKDKENKKEEKSEEDIEEKGFGGSKFKYDKNKDKNKK